MKIFISVILLISLFNCFIFNLKANQLQDTTVIYLSVFGLKSTGKKDCTEIIRKAFDKIPQKAPKKVLFPAGKYHFYPDKAFRRTYFESNTTDINSRVCTFLFENMKNLVIEGNGSTLIFHEQMQPFTFDSCENVLLKNVKINWEQPLIAQAEVLETGEEYIELAINSKESPYKIMDGKLMFKKKKREYNKWTRTMEYDREGKFVVPQTGDRGCLGRGWQNYVAENIIPGIIRLNHNFLRKPAIGNFLILRHAERIHSGVFIQHSKNIILKNVAIYHATGLGILAQFSENVTLEGYRAIPDPNSNRYFGGGDDGLQVSNCRGIITVKNCEFAGLQDDPINVHGTSVQVQKIISPTELECKFMHHQSVGMEWGHPGDSVSFIENEQMNSIGTGIVKTFEKIDIERFLVTFKNPVPANLQEKDALENLTWSPDLHISNSHFKSCRARGVLVSTPGKVVIENNVFESSGSAILIAGDANGWFESGAVKDVLIENNEFTDLCNTSSYQFCEGIISIFPIIPEFNKNTPQFHRNIRIKNNRFNPFDYPVLYAKSVDGISFENNLVNRSYRFKPYHRRKFTFSFEGCKNITIQNNTFSNDILGKNILLNKTPEKELKTNSDLKIEFQE